LAKFLDTTGVSYHLQQLLKDTKEKLVLISPYLKINERLKQSLQDLDRFKIDIRIVFGKNELDPVEQNWLRGLPAIRTSFCQNLHAKCYLNEKQAIITSMNLYEFSQVNNQEMGVLIERDQDSQLYSQVYEEASRLVRISDEIKITVAQVPKTPVPIETKSGSAALGHCIKCNAEIKLNPMVPYCRECYAQWKKKSDDSQEEKFCHICGKASKSSLNKPSCYDCYKANKEKLEFPLLSK
jgi:phosphatidylserine/phosphatidylglycerophosphate/cardiolipin synthase-like enzyme